MSVEEVLARYGIAGAIVASQDGEVVLRAGNPERPEFTYLASESFGSPESVKRTRQFLDGKSLPQMNRQGKAYCMLSKIWGMDLGPVLG